MRKKHLEMGAYTKYNTNRSMVSEVGLNVVVPIGKGYQDIENEKINARLNRLEQKVGGIAVVEKTLDSKGNLKSVSISDSGFSLTGTY